MLKNLRITLKTVETAAILMLVTSTAVYADEITNTYKNVTIKTNSNEVKNEVHITGTNNSDKEIKFLVKKDGVIGKWYNVKNEEKIDRTIELLDGTGTYNIYAMIYVEGNRYSYGPSLTVENADEQIQTSNKTYDNEINTQDTDIAALSKKLTAGKKTSREKIEAIYNWMVENITYDYDKYNNMLKKDFSGQYGALAAFESKKGVCYDYATLFAELCKASDIQVKVDKGYSVNLIGYHAWNEVYDADSSQWMILDTTVDSIKYHKTGKKTGMVVRAESEYNKTSEM